MLALPPRYEPQSCLGAGGSGEVWAVRDRVSGRDLALKVLCVGAGEPEIDALVREAVSLSGLEGLGVPRVIAFGALGDGRRYMVRELVPGTSLDEVLKSVDTPWLEPLANACDALTVVHRAGLLHGDIKPANIIVGPDGRGTLVDLGLAAPWREGGSDVHGITPKFAAPELLRGEPLTARAEVYALGATLREGLARRGPQLPLKVRAELSKVAARATDPFAERRWPSVDEFCSALRHAGELASPPVNGEPPWPVTGLEGLARDLLAKARALPVGSGLVLVGPPGSGRSTLLRRLAWTLGADGCPVAFVQAPDGHVPTREAVKLELASVAPPDGGERATAPATVIIDDADDLDADSRGAIADACKSVARLVAVGLPEALSGLIAGPVVTFEVPELAPAVGGELLRRSMPSLSDDLCDVVLQRVSSRPGPLRTAVRRLVGKAIVSAEDVDSALSETKSVADDRPRAEAIASVERDLDRGRFDDASLALAALGEAQDDSERVAFALGRARLALGKGDVDGALAELSRVEAIAAGGASRRVWQGLRARALVRAGRYAEAADLGRDVVADDSGDAVAADALSVRGVALAFLGDDNAAREVLDTAVRIATGIGDPRLEAVALGSAAVAHQRAGRMADARAAYEASLAASEKASDAATVAAMRLNLAGLARIEGDLGLARAHLEAAADMGQRAGSGVAVTQALLNLANLDLYLGRWAHARTSIDALALQRDTLPPAAVAQLLGLEAEHAARTGEAARGAELYEQTARAWDQQGRPHDAAEARLEGLLARAREPGCDASNLMRAFVEIRTALGEAGFAEHAALAEFVRGTIARVAKDEDTARRALDAAIALARKAGRGEWAWQALDERARLSTAQGGLATARRDTEAALAMLEDTAARLPQDLREVFWDDPRRRALRQTHAATLASPSVLAPVLTHLSAGTLSEHRTQNAAARTEDRLARVLEITRELARERDDLPRLLECVTDHAVALLGAERGFVLLIGPNGDLEAHAARSPSGEHDPHARFSRSVAERVVAEGEPVVTLSARDDARLAEAVSVHRLMIQSIACVPIRGTPPVGRTIGALYVETRLRPGVHFQRELPILSAFADQAAVAIESARLLTENRSRAEELARANAQLAAARDELAGRLGKRTEQLAEVRRDLRQVRAGLRSHFGYGGLIGTSAAMRRVYALMDRVKDTDVPILITGESGTGKEMVARALHATGPRGKHQFVGLNCAAIPANLLESELFGSVRGAFTGADRDRRGLFKEADCGTLLLDEVGEMPQKMQAGLLRVLQDRTVRPVGSSKEEAIDVRVIAATHRDLPAMVAEGTFREDLFYRLQVIELHVPPLRERLEDIAPLIDHFLTRFSTRYQRDRKSVSRVALRKLSSYGWPGNVRQLEHVLLGAWLMTEQAEIGPEDIELPARPTPTGEPGPRARSARPSPPREVPDRSVATTEEFKESERARILQALEACNWNRLHAAQRVGLPRRTFYRRLKEFGIL
jgi:transcriptional regulator with GAF, ATPase, and Fis domain